MGACNDIGYVVGESCVMKDNRADTLTLRGRQYCSHDFGLINGELRITWQVLYAGNLALVFRFGKDSFETRQHSNKQGRGFIFEFRSQSIKSGIAANLSRFRRRLESHLRNMNGAGSGSSMWRSIFG